MAERFQEVVNIQPQDVGTGRAEALRSLADRLEDFKSQALTVAGQQAAQRGVESAGQVELTREGGVTQAPAFRTEGLLGRNGAIAHNKALRGAYVASLGNDISENVSSLELANSDDVISFNDSAEGYAKGIIKGVDPSVRGDVNNFLQSKLSAARTRVHGRDIAKQQAEAKDSITTATENAANDAARNARNGEILESGKDTARAFLLVDQSIDAGFLSEGDGQRLKREIERETQEQLFRREFDQLSDQSIPAALDMIEEKRDKVPKGWTPDEWDTYLTSQNQEINRKRANLTKDLKATKVLIEDRESLARGQQFMDPDIPADPAKSGQDRKDVNRAFEEFSKNLAGQSAGEQIEGIEQFVINTGIVPDVLISRSSASMRSGNTDNVIVFSKVINDLASSQNPSVLSDLPAQARAVALQIQSSTEAGLDIETATEIARKNAYGLTETDKKRIQLETQAIRPDLPGILADVLDANFDPSIIPFIEEPSVNPAIQADFNVAFEQFMTLTDGDAEQSTKLASEALIKNWGVNDIDGDFRMMKFAPSVFYSVQGVDDGWMQDQFQADVGQFGDVDNFRLGINIDSLNTGQPTYPVMNVDPNGIIQPVFDDEGNLLEWAPDFRVTREYQELKALPGKKLQEGIELKQKADRLDEILKGQLQPLDKLPGA